jgi:hypothetical protein
MQQSENFNTIFFCSNLQRHQTSFCGENALLTAEKWNSTKASHKLSRWKWYRTRQFFACQFFLVVWRLIVSKNQIETDHLSNSRNEPCLEWNFWKMKTTATPIWAERKPLIVVSIVILNLCFQRILSKLLKSKMAGMLRIVSI